jgi:hypothetical protein
VLEAVSQVRRQERQRSRQAKAAAKCSSEFDADDSIISSADGLSFNYEEKSLEEDAFTVRREYKCQQQLDPALRQQLRLNFDGLHDDDPFDCESDPSDPPTI